MLIWRILISKKFLGAIFVWNHNLPWLKMLFINAPAPLIVPGNQYSLSILNSKLTDFYLRTQGVSRNGGYFEYKPTFVEKMPIVKK